MRIYPTEIEIIEFTEALAEPIRSLNYEWLQRYFRVEEGDAKVLADPQKYIIGRGGFIYYAQWQGETVGTASLLKKSEGLFELGKMAVTARAQGLGIGKRLIAHCLQEARQKKTERLILYSNTQLSAAIHLYRKFGFTEVPLESGLYARANIKMELKL